MLTARTKVVAPLGLVCSVVAVVLVFAAPWHWLKLVGGVLFACGPLGVALVYWSDSDGQGVDAGPGSSTRSGAGLRLAASWAMAAIATCLTVFMVSMHPAALFGANSHLLRASPVKPRTWKGVAQPLGVPGNWSLVLDSEFNGPSLNTSIWQTGLYSSGGITTPANSLEADCYNTRNLAFPGDGSMHLNVTATPSRCGGVSYPYTGALISSNPFDRRSGGFQYRYGVFEAKVYLPAAGPIIADWPAVWTIGQHWPTDGEDDVMEGLFGYACFHFHSLHFHPHGPGGCVTSVRPGWHTFASVWKPGSVSYYYDGIEVGRVTEGVTSSPMFLIVDNTVWKNTPNQTRLDSMRIAYVRVWQQTGPNAARVGYMRSY